MYGKRLPFCLTLMILLGAFLARAAPAVQIVDRIVAYVNDDIITLSELEENVDQYIALRRLNPLVKNNKESLDQIRRTILENMIDERLAQQEISRLKITVSEAEIDQAVDKIRRENHMSQAALEAQLRKEGKTIEELRETIKSNLKRSRLINLQVRRKTVITDEQIDKYYKAHLQEFQEKARQRLQDIFLPLSPEMSAQERSQVLAQAHHILQQLKQGQDFAALARRYSRGPGAAEGGELGYFSKGELDPVIEEAIKDLGPGDLSPVIETSRGVHIIRIVEVDRTAAKSLDEVRDRIRAKLYREEMNRKFRQWLKGLRERSYIKIVY
ncbi:MAG: peptidylprolyl isomerase [Deltaproteobacteria bacterium]|nr:peptidylprolyl isomerase [Deltaproteobacteria bacterium]MBW2069954.1 peptidylprolyl isomerase [Deltaproteobacteria bacterium]